MDNFATVSVLGIPLIFVVQGLVEYVKKLGLEGKVLLGVSLALGLVLGAGYQLAALGFPTEFAGWFGVGLYGLGLGVVASGVYDSKK